MGEMTVLVTGSTDGIGRLTAEKLLDKGCRVILHGRSASRVDAVAPDAPGVAGRYVADFAEPAEVRAMAGAIRDAHPRLDALINNAGVLKVDTPHVPGAIDLRFAVNTIAPYLLTQALLPCVPKDGRIVNVVSAAQRAVDPDAPFNPGSADHMTVYAQSKLALMIWTRVMAQTNADGPSFVGVNPGSLLASKMVREGLGYRGRSLDIGADILSAAVLDATFQGQSGAYYDNDKQRFADPDAAVDDPVQIETVMKALSAQAEIQP